jgi:hypothetical protein
MFELDLHKSKRTVKEWTREAREQIADAIMLSHGYRANGLTWDFKAIIEQIYEHGEADELCVNLHAITAATDSLARTEAVNDLLDWLRSRVEEHIPERMVEELAAELERESEVSADEIAHKDRLLAEGR